MLQAKKKKVRLFFLMVIPPLAVYIFFEVIPFLQTFYYAFTDWNGISDTYNFIGFKNFIKLGSDSTFWTSFWHNMKFCIYGGIGTFVIALLNSALLSHSKVKGKNFFRAVFFIPNILSITVVSMLWLLIYNPNFGLLNSFLNLFTHTPITKAWLGTKSTALICLISPWVWMSVGFYMVLFNSAIEGMPDSYFEAAEIDGASKWQTFWYITMPLLKETIRTALVFFFINAFSGVFTLVNVMTDGAPAKSTEVMTNYMYRIAFQQSNMGYATAIGVVVFLFVLFLTGIMLLLTRSKDVLEY
ncbi:MAG: sugar ABC transporter permease [Lachnospiraceae bacterium]|nr:sugar ABC transporter permease [Lachnospiraceae bacterium]